MDPRYGAAHPDEDRAHWWFVGRRAVVLAEMARRLPGAGLRVVEIGCGSGGMLEALDRFGSALGVAAAGAPPDPFTLRATDVCYGGCAFPCSSWTDSCETSIPPRGCAGCR